MTSDDGAIDFEELKLHPFTSLEKAARTRCEGCDTSRRYWCGACCRLLVSDGPPSVSLPVSIDVIQSAAETPQKSTAQHIAILAPQFGKVWRPFPDCMTKFHEEVVQSAEKDTVAVLYPSTDALTPAEAAEKLPPLKRLIVVDANWSKSVHILSSDELKGLPHVKLPPPPPGAVRQSRFWRYAPTRGAESKMFNEDSVKSLLSTVEAVHGFCNAYAKARGLIDEDGAYDNLLWLFAFNWHKVREVYVTAPGKRARIMRKSKGLMSEF